MAGGAGDAGEAPGRREKRRRGGTWRRGGTGHPDPNSPPPLSPLTCRSPARGGTSRPERRGNLEEKAPASPRLRGGGGAGWGHAHAPASRRLGGRGGWGHTHATPLSATPRPPRAQCVPVLAGRVCPSGGGGGGMRGYRGPHVCMAAIRHPRPQVLGDVGTSCREAWVRTLVRLVRAQVPLRAAQLRTYICTYITHTHTLSRFRCGYT